MSSKPALRIYKPGETRVFGRSGKIAPPPVVIPPDPGGSADGTLDFSDANQSALLVALGII